MLVGINKNPEGKITPYLKKYIDILYENNIEYTLLNINEPDFWEKARNLDLFIHRWQTSDDYNQITTTFLPILEKYLNVKCFPDLNTSWHYDDKIKHYTLLKQLGYPVINSWVFWDRKKALEWVDKAEFPIVFKFKRGASGNGVKLLTHKFEAIRLINKMFGKGILPGKNKKILTVANAIKKITKKKPYVPNYWQYEKNYVFFQKYMPDNKWDTRVYVIGERAFAARRLNRDNDFRASGSGRDDKNPENIDKRFIKIALKIVKEMKFQVMAFDFIYCPEKTPQICEISYTMPDEPVFLMHGYWDSNLTFHEGNYWPQYFHLVDLLNMPNLKLPENLNVKLNDKIQKEVAIF